MASYYGAQLGIALSVVDERVAQSSQMEKSIQNVASQCTKPESASTKEN